ncbi:T9SS type A sorting domain-containing protein [Carboxylicivirga sediminis]|uniref:T9SS type A sorting domain-containing protein n=1 Tax=Carboxylicivirga sediminis TaxID=2006564 RepID=A0A941F7K1_9BACT|nr:right-handed parallel beta-helix repeat-containing protein [Carboxylicivirga sediminis]MBR8538218.1 T9SS type A sorting domain-containing protein [Carboxylicivirga sediminis]
MRRVVLLIYMAVMTSGVMAQTVVFSDDFESYALNDELSTLGYVFSKKADYPGTISTSVQSNNDNQYAACVASENGQTLMQLRKEVDVTAGKQYKLSIKTTSPFKRHLRVYQSDGITLLNQGEDFTPTEAQKTQWIDHEMTFTAGAGMNTVYVGVFHNWSGTLLVDEIKVEEVVFTELSDYYISSSEGDDANDGTIDAPFQSLEKISQAPLKPGNTVNFKCGDRFDGHFVVNGSGTTDYPITITSYGEGNKPIITGEIGAAAGGDYQEAILVENHDNLIFDGLEINNERTVNRTGVDETDAYGIYVLNTGAEIMRNFVFRNMTFQKVYAPKPILQGEGEDAFNGLEVAAVRFYTAKNTVAGQEKNIQDVLMEDCYFTDLQRLGVHMKHAGGTDGIGDEMINRNMNLVFRNNEFHYIGGTCILPTKTYNCLIEDNLFNHPGSDVDPRMPNRGSSVWTWRCYNTVIQRNRCISTRGYLDSHGIHIDHENHNTFVQYNYMEDCEGGFVEILGGNVNAVYRFNVSVNDGWRENPNWTNSNHTIWINQNGPGGVTHYCDYSYIYNNTVVIDEPYSTAIDINGKNTHIFNNIFYSVNGAGIGSKQMIVQNNGTPLFMKNNLFFGIINQNFKNLDTNPLYGDPKFKSMQAEDMYQYQLESTSPAINTGVAKLGPPVPGAGTGIFKDVPEYPTVDFYGNPIDLSTGTPNIGACNAKNGEATAIDDVKLKPLMVYPNPTDGIINIGGLEKKSCVKVFDLKGRKVLEEKVVKQLNVGHIDSGLYVLMLDGYQPQKMIIK